MRLWSVPMKGFRVGNAAGLTIEPSGRWQIETRYAKDATEGFGTCDYQWQVTGGLPHESRPGLGLDFTWFRLWKGNFFAAPARRSGVGAAV